MKRAYDPVTAHARERGAPTRGTPAARSVTSPQRLQAAISRIGNANANALLGDRTPDTHNKLAMSRPGDPDEREADAAADRIMASTRSKAQTPKCATWTAPIREPVVAGHDDAPTPDGGPLPATTRQFFETRLGADLSAVRVHHGQHAHAAAIAVGARAYSEGPDVTFAKGQFAPDRPEGMRLLAHELTHVVQTQRGAPRALRRQPFSAGLTPDDVIVRNAAPVTPHAHSNDPLSRYPTLITALDDNEYEQLEAAVAAYRPYQPIRPNRRGTTCPLTRLLDLDARPAETGSLTGAVLPQLLTGSPVPLILALAMRNEVLSRFLTLHYPLETAKVGIEIQPLIGPPELARPKAGGPATKAADEASADPPTLAFVLGAQTIPIADGFIHLSDLNQAAGSPLAGIAADVQQEVDRLADGASHILSGRAARTQLPTLAAQMLMLPEDYALADVRALQTETNELADALRALSTDISVAELNGEAAELVAALLPGQAGLDAAVTVITRLHQRTAVGSTGKETYEYMKQQSAELQEEGYTLGSVLMAKSAAKQRVGEGMLNFVTGGALEDIDQSILEYRAGTISLSAYRSLVRHAVIKAGLAIGISVAAGMLGGWLGGLAGRAVFGAGVGASMAAGFGGGALGGVSFLGTQDLYSLTVAALSTDPQVRARMRAGVHTGTDYLIAGGVGGLVGTAFGGVMHSPAPGATTPPIVSEPITLLDAAGRPLRIQGGRILPTPPYQQPTLFGPDGLPLSGGTGAPPMLVDPAGRPIAGPPSGSVSTLTGESRLVGPSGDPLSGGPAGVPPVLVDPYGRPVAPAPPTGPVIVDLQSGTTTFLDDLTARTPGSRGIGVESGRWLLSYQGVNPTNPSDLELALGVARNAPVWPDTPAWNTPLAQTPALLPWEIDPASTLFPRTGTVSVNPDAFFPASGQGGRLVPFNIRDIPAGGIQPTTHPALHGVADQIYLRRPFGLAFADPETTVALGQELNRMLKPVGFVEFRLRAQTELSVPAPGAEGVDQSAVVAGRIDNARVVRVDRGAIQRFQRTGQLPTDPAEAEVLKNAAADVRGLGEGGYARIIRIYKGGP